MMLICSDCGNVFSEDSLVDCPEYYPYGDTMAGYECAYSPCCGGGYDEAFECDECGEYFIRQDLVNNCCKDCTKDKKC